MPQLSLKIGPAGVRGRVGESLTPQLVTGFAAAFGTYCGAGPILVGTDARRSGEMVKQAAIAGLLSVGCIPVDVGIVPVPALMLHAREAGAFGAIAIGGSDWAPEWNAMKFIGSGGLPLRPNQAAELTDLYHQGFYPRVHAADMPEVRVDATTIERHLRAVTRAVDVEAIRARGLKVVVHPGGGAASVPAPLLLEALGCEVAVVDPAGVHGPGADLPDEDLDGLANLVRETGADVGFAQDADAARLAVVDESGTSLGPAATLALVLQRRLESHPGGVVVDVATSRVVDDVARRFGVPVYRSRVGEPSLLESMTEHGAELGGDSAGGVVVVPINPCLDSFAGMALILESMAVSGAAAGELRAGIPRYAMLRERLLCPARDIAPSLRVIKSLFPGEQFDLTDGVKVAWSDRWLLARPSTSEPVIKLAAEAPTEADARALVNQVLEALIPGA